MSTVSLLSLLQRLPVGTTRRQAQALLKDEPAWAKALKKHAQHLDGLYKHEKEP